jgi:hypothetical protein
MSNEKATPQKLKTIGTKLLTNTQKDIKQPQHVMSISTIRFSSVIASPIILFNCSRFVFSAVERSCFHGTFVFIINSLLVSLEQLTIIHGYINSGSTLE